MIGDLSDQTRQEYALWFDSLQWDWFASFTVVLGARESAAFIWRCLSRWSRVMERENRRRLRQVAALEWQRRGTAHLHNLVYGVRPDADVVHAQQVWANVSGGGMAVIRRYFEKGGAASYVVKTVSDDMELRLLGPWPR